MYSYLKNNMYKLIYFILIFTAVLRISSFEDSVSKDRKFIEDVKNCSVTVRVTSVPQYSGDLVNFFGVCEDGLNIDSKAYVTMSHAQNAFITAGDTLTFNAKPSVPKKALNPGGFDFGNYIKSNGASIILSSDITNITNHDKSFLKHIYSVRSKVGNKIFTYFEPKEASLINALVTGDKTNMSDEQKEGYRRSGIYHIIAVSGLHLGMLLLFLSLIYVNIKMKNKIQKYLILFITVFGSLFLYTFTGFGVSVQRAALMALILGISSIVYREYSPYLSLLLILLLTIITEPSSYLNVSMQLSFSATFGVLVGVKIIDKYNIHSKKFHLILESVIISQCANLATMPFVVSQFGYVSLVCVLTNLVVIPFVPMLLFMSYIFSIFSIFAPHFIMKTIANAVSAPAYAINMISDFFGSFPISYIALNIKELCIICCEVLCLAFIVRIKDRRIKYSLSVIFLIANISFVSYNYLREDTEVHFINVGQGDCTVIRDFKGGAFMIDAGSETESDIAENEIIPYLQNQGIKDIDLLFVTHFHTDHTSGIILLMKKGYIKKLVLPQRILNEDEITSAKEIYSCATENNIEIIHVSKSDRLSYNKEHMFDIIHPSKNFKGKTNNASCVIRYSYKGSSVLFLGDTGEASQYMMRDSLYDCDILKISHHGAYSSMNELVKEKTSPQYAVISCAKDNSYGHPHESTLETFKNSKILRTDVNNGPFVIRFDKGKIKLLEGYAWKHK